MQLANVSGIQMESTGIESVYLKRKLLFDLYLPAQITDPASLELLLINDGQNMEDIGLKNIL